NILDKNILQISVELEFFLFGPANLKRNFFRDLLAKATELNFEVSAVVDELGENQYEIRMQFKDPRKFMDQLYLIRLLMQDLAEVFELKLNFIPKDNLITYGNGLHIRIEFSNE